MSGSIEASVDTFLGEDKTVDSTAAEVTQQPGQADNTPTTGAGEQQQRTDAGATQQQPTTQPVGQPQQPSGKGGGANPSTQQRPQAGPVNPAAAGYMPQDNAGNLLDREGRIVATAGRERHYFEAARNNYRQLQTTTTQMRQLESQLAEARGINTLPQQLGLEASDVTTAMQFMAHWRRDPKGAAQKMLAELAASGQSIEGLTPGVDTQAIARMMDERLRPFQQDHQQREAQTKAREAAQEQVNALFEMHPWAQFNQEEIGRVMDADSRLTMGEAALHVLRFADKHGLDVNRSITQQLADRNGAAPTTGAAPQPRPNQARAAIPAASNGVGVKPATNNGASLGANTSTRDILRATFAEHGIPLEG